MTFDYRGSALRVPVGVIAAVLVVGLGMAVWFGVALARPYVASVGDRTTPGTVASWSTDFIPNSATANYGMTIRYTVGSHAYAIQSTYQVQPSTMRAHPVGSTVTVQYDPGHPASGEWVPAFTDVAVDFWNVVLFVLGVILLGSGFLGLVLNRPLGRKERVVTATALIVAFFVVVIVVVLIVTGMRIRGQRVSMHDGLLVTSAAGEREASIPDSDIGTVLSVSATDGGSGYKMGVFDFGGLIILNTSGKLIRVIRHYPGSTLPLDSIFEQLPAPTKIDFTGKQRSDLVTMYPHALGFFQLRGQVFWGLVIAGAILALILTACLVAALVAVVAAFAG